MAADQFQASFRIYSQTHTAAEVTLRLGLTPSRSHEAGDQIRSRNPVPRYWDGSMWSLSSRRDQSEPLEQHLAEVLDQLAGKEGVLTELAASYEMDWFCLVGAEGSQGSVELSRAVLARLVTLPGDLILDLYVSGESSELSP